MNGSEDEKRVEAEQKAIARALDAKKRKKILIKFVIWTGVVLAALFILWLVLKSCSVNKTEQQYYSYDPASMQSETVFTTQTLDDDIFEDPVYADKDKGIRFQDSNGEGTYYLPEDRNGATSQIRLFIDYFDAAIHGDGNRLNALFTNEYFINDGRTIKKYPDRFLMQKIYAVNVEKMSSSTVENTKNGPVLRESYIVSFLIMDNNGAFRPDLADDEKSSIPLIFDVVTFEEESKIDRIRQINRG